MPGMKSVRASVVRQPVSDAPMNARRHDVADMIVLCHVKLQYLTWLACQRPSLIQLEKPVQSLYVGHPVFDHSLNSYRPHGWTDHATAVCL